MPLEVQLWLLLAALAVLIVMQGVQSYLLLKAMGDTEKFGRLLRKVRHHLKLESASR